jgi:hypothetical protein
MNQPEFIILGTNIFIVLIAYFVVYPHFCGSNGNKISVNDLIATGLSLMVAGYLFYGTSTKFSLLIVDVNWFWFSLLTYFAMEMPLMIWYFNKHNVWDSYRPKE